jgi:hypothetical protein
VAAFRSRRPPPTAASAITFAPGSAALDPDEHKARPSASQLALHEMPGRKAPRITLDLSAQDSAGFKVLVGETMARSDDGTASMP